MAKALWRYLGVSVVIGLMATRGVAQIPGGSDLRMVSSFVDPGEPVPAECLEQGTFVAEVIRALPSSGRWHWVLLCDEAGWQRFLRLSDRAGRDDIYASTDLETRTTYLRGGLRPCFRDFRPAPEKIIAHELAHIRLGGGEEAAADRLGERWERILRASSAVEAESAVAGAAGN